MQPWNQKGQRWCDASVYQYDSQDFGKEDTERSVSAAPFPDSKDAQEIVDVVPGKEEKYFCETEHRHFQHNEKRPTIIKAKKLYGWPPIGEKAATPRSWNSQEKKMPHEQK
ncbi:hypothetical protein QAD02_007689 [Eretmocerus hayati]|uniref:Uncharacterized protein n=1 Tax=Eretmocerus hayati TaxID=131215 RepID=A0ACC2N6T7_9HYME|nr:hypothetical protein QAD02_007689 [Eretmocerus hayati]